MNYQTGMKFTIRLGVKSTKCIDFWIYEITPRGAYRMTYSYHNKSSKGTTDYTAKQMDKFFDNKNWILESSNFPSNLPEELFTL
jgi:hypothetical protein